MSARSEELDRMTDFQAIASLEAEFTGWMIHRGANRLCYGSDKATERRDAVWGEDWVDLRYQIIRDIWHRSQPAGRLGVDRV